MLVEHLRRLNIPICCGFPVGNNSFLPLVEGANVQLDVNDKETTLTFEMEGNAKPIHTKEIAIPLFR
jgi:muramoyltetrapeptide carboxypeptidase